MSPPPSPIQDPLLASSQVSELASGVDALYLSGRALLADEVLQHLEAVRAWAVEADSAVPVVVAGEEFSVQPRAFGKYRFRLAHEAGLFGITPSERLPTLRIQPWSEYLDAVGPSAALDFFEAMGPELVRGPVGWGLSRLDLFCDVQGWELNGDDRHDFVCRGERLDTHEDGSAFTGLEFGRRTTKTVCARIYDKTRQVEKEGLDWWPMMWGERFDPDRPVLRIEFELGRQGLVEYGARTPRQALEMAPRLWASVTSDWLTYRVEADDGTRSRWPVSPHWARIQHASLRDDALGAERVRAGKRHGDLRRLTPQLVGYLASLGGILDLDDIGSVLGAARVLVSEDEERRGLRFSERVLAKQAERRPS